MRRHTTAIRWLSRWNSQERSPWLVTCVATDAANGDVLMVAHMNAEALARTIERGEAWYYSRARRALWRKGESSGHVQRGGKRDRTRWPLILPG
jgi:phosphoribosyl-AMP cyclohydrolase